MKGLGCECSRRMSKYRFELLHRDFDVRREMAINVCDDDVVGVWACLAL